MNGSVYLPLEWIENMLILGVCTCTCAVLLILLTLYTVPLAYLGLCNLKGSISLWTCVIRGEHHLAGVCAGVQDTITHIYLTQLWRKATSPLLNGAIQIYVKQKKNIYICIYINLFGIFIQLRQHIAVKKSQQWYKCWIYTLVVFPTHSFTRPSYTHEKRK